MRPEKLSVEGFLKKSMGDWRYPFLWASWWLARLLVPRRSVQINSIKFTLSCSNWITHFRWYLIKKKDSEVNKFIDQYVNDGDTFFDVGANVGVFSLYAAKRYPNLSVYSFEPEYSNLALLKENIIENSLHSQIQIYAVAISDVSGLSHLHLQDIAPGSACHTESVQGIEKTGEGYSVVWSEGIATAALDHFCEQLKIEPSVLKIDTDGNEDKVLKGARGVLMNPKLTRIIIEIPLDEKKKLACYQMLESANFQKKWSDLARTRNEIWIKNNPVRDSGR